MTVLDDFIPGKVTEVLAKYGKDITIAYGGVKFYNPATGQTAVIGSSTQTVKASPFDANVAEYTEDNTLREATEAVTIIAAENLDMIPIIGMQIAEGDSIYVESTWRIIRVQKIESGEEVAAWLLFLVGGQHDQTIIATPFSAGFDTGFE